MKDRAAELSRSESFWLRKAKMDLLTRDPVDAANDAEALVQFALDRLAVMLRDMPVGERGEAADSTNGKSATRGPRL